MSEEKNAPEVSLNDTISGNRALPIIDSTAVPVPPAGYRTTPIDIRRRVLRRVADGLEEELLAALREYAAHKEAITTDLGPKAPPASLAETIVSRLETVQRTQSSVALLKTYLNEVEEIALSDAAELLDRAKKRLDPELDDNPALRASYEKLLKFFGAKGAAISEGMARAKEK